MKRALVVEFTKMNGAGNDFIVIDNRFFYFRPEELSALAARFCPRRTGIGADGLLALSKPRDEAHHYRMQYYNADGSLATMCGNGARCLARFARRAGLSTNPLVFETEAGLFEAEVPADEAAPVRLRMNAPEHWHPHFQLTAPEKASGAVHYIWTGTEHLVQFVEDVDACDVDGVGAALRHDANLAPKGANANFVSRIEGAEAALRVRTYEKGVEAETLACGTGALAAAVAARLLGQVSADKIEVHMPGGVLGVEIEYDQGEIAHLYLEGPAEAVYRGTVEV